MDEQSGSSAVPLQSGIGMDTIFNTGSYVTRPPVELVFQPWHKPRKQMVREKQWGDEIDWLLRNKPENDSSIRYLGLPGPDLLDIRYIYDRFCRGSGRKMTFLGFDKSAQASSPLSDALNVSLDEVRRLENIDNRSLVLGDDFRLLAKSNSLAFDWTGKLGPFDVINVDLCKNAVRDDPSIDTSLYNAIHKLFGVQQRRPYPWSLFLTTRVGQDGFSATAFGKLLDIIQRNLNECAPFETAFQEAVGAAAIDFANAGSWNDREFFNVMGIALAKWLLGLASPMRTKFSVQSSFGYRVQSESACCDMLSVVLRFQPINQLPVDGSGLASTKPEFPTECSQAAKIPQRISHTRDLDQELESDPNLWNQYRETTASLLQQARYDPADYREWAEVTRSKQNGTAEHE